MLVLEQTTKLIEECEQCVTRFWQMREEDRTPDFYQEVKPYADELHTLLTEWQRRSQSMDTQAPAQIYAHTANCFSKGSDGAICCAILL